MNQSLDDAVQEIKRVDHLVTVSLKYTRTVDVLKNVVHRIISAFEFIVTALVEDLKEKKIIKEIPSNPGSKVSILQKCLSDNKELQDYIDFYMTLRKIIRAKYEKKQEYRRHVTMIAALDDGTTMDVDIDLLEEYFLKTREFFKFARALIEGEKNE